MNLVPYVVAYIAVGIFLVAVMARFFMWSRMPIHVRWELYPVAHEASRAHYGGSYLEETDWWKKPREKSMMGELKAMIPEILFLVALKEHNNKLWTRSFPFHFGLYLVIGATVVMFGWAVLAALIPSLAAGGLASVAKVVVMGLGYAGLGLGLIGALGLIHARLTFDDLRDFTAPADMFNLIFFVVAFGVALASAVLVDGDFSRVQAFVYGLVTFNMTGFGGEGLAMILPTLAVLLLGALVTYIPMTHMSHFVGKFFAYHSIRWNDEPNLRGGDQEAQIQGVLNLPVSWDAPHIKGEGKKSWAEVATEEANK